MRRIKSRAVLTLASSLLAFSFCVLPACSAAVEEQSRDISAQIREIAAPYAFSIAGWEMERLFSPLTDAERERRDILCGQIRPVIKEEGIALFPPFAVALEQPPHLLVISPRDRIEYADRYLLMQEIAVDDMERMEKSIESLGMSALVVKLGGFGATYPPVVADDAGITFTINAIVEEWLHQYLAFRPLGFRYLLDSIGIRQAAEIIEMNETLAGMVSEEIGLIVRSRHYPETLAAPKPEEGGFDFDAEMSITRRTADLYLAQGKIDEAERYMEERRLVFTQNGYRIRKINQAYFAFHGIYGQDPASVSPAQQDLAQLRAQSGSIKAFLEEASSFKSYQDLSAALGH